jgi:hypothetical protein
VLSASYPNLLTEDLPAIAVKAFLVTYDYNLQTTREHLARFARSLCRNFATLQEKGHPKWREVELALPSLGQGWFYYQPTSAEMRACIERRSVGVQVAAPATKGAPKSCSQEQRLLGLCD